MPSPCCIVIGCANATHNPIVKYYPVPVGNINLCKQWYINTLREDLPISSEHHVCIEHFDEESFLTPINQQELNTNLILKDDAVPSLFEIEVFQKMISHQETLSANRLSSIQTINLQSLTDSTHTSSQHTQMHQTSSSLLNSLINGTQQRPKCSIPSCQNTFDDLYPLPKVNEIASKWMTACRLYDANMRVCRKHFTTSDFNEYNFLKADAVPSQYLTSTSNVSPFPNTNKRARIDPDQRAELIARVPKAVKRTSAITGPKPSMTAAQLLNKQATQQSTRAARQTHQFQSLPIPPPLPNNGTIVNTTSRFLSAALNSSPTLNVATSSSSSISPTSRLPISRGATSHHQQSSNKTQKAIKHTSANLLLKEILPPPIMQSTKRTPKAVKQTTSFFNQTPLTIQSPTQIQNSSIKLTVAAPSAAGKSSMVSSLQTPLQVNHAILNQQQNGTEHLGQRTTTYVYKRINQQPEIELQLECEEDEPEEESSKEETSSKALQASIGKVKSSELTPKKYMNSMNTLKSTKFDDSEKKRKSSLSERKSYSGINEVEKALIHTVLKYYARKNNTEKQKFILDLFTSLILIF